MMALGGIRSTLGSRGSVLAILCSLLLFFTSAPVVSAGSVHYTLATATTGGTYYPVGVALATLTKVRLEPHRQIALTAISSAGSAENIVMMREDRAQFAILQSLYGAWAYHGTGQLLREGPQQWLRSVTMLWQNVEHFVIRSDFVRSADMSDLSHLRDSWFSLGQRRSGTEGSGRYILTQLGFTPEDDFQIASIDYGSNALAIQNGSIDGMNIPGGPPVSGVSQAFAALGKDLTILNVTDSQLESVNRRYPLWTRYIIPPATYPGQDKAVQTIAQPNFLAVRNDVDDETVYQIVKTIYENLDFLHIIHSATRALSLEKAINNMVVPLHPGAARYYREQGIEIPDHLIVP